MEAWLSIDLLLVKIDQTAQMHRLVCVYARHAQHKIHVLIL